MYGERKNGHQKWCVLMFNPIFPTNIVKKLWKTVRRTCMLIVRLEGYLTIILRGRAGYRMIDNQRGA